MRRCKMLFAFSLLLVGGCRSANVDWFGGIYDSVWAAARNESPEESMERDRREFHDQIGVSE